MRDMQSTASAAFARNTIGYLVLTSMWQAGRRTVRGFLAPGYRKASATAKSNQQINASTCPYYVRNVGVTTVRNGHIIFWGQGSKNQTILGAINQTECNADSSSSNQNYFWVGNKPICCEAGTGKPLQSSRGLHHQTTSNVRNSTFHCISIVIASSR